MIKQATPGMAEQIARVASAFELERTGRMPESVTVVLRDDIVVITFHEPLSPAERSLAKSPAGAAQVLELHREHALRMLYQEIDTELDDEDAPNP